MDEKDRWSTKYREGLAQFLEIAKNHIDSRGLIRCPCRKCKNVLFQTWPVMENHLAYKNMIDPYYRNWVRHGEALDMRQNLHELNEVVGVGNMP